METEEKYQEDISNLERRINLLIEILRKYSNIPEEAKEKLRWI